MIKNEDILFLSHTGYLKKDNELSTNNFQTLVDLQFLVSLNKMESYLFSAQIHQNPSRQFVSHIFPRRRAIHYNALYRLQTVSFFQS